MATPENPRQADYYGVPSQFGKGVFSPDPKQEKELTEYFLWLQRNFASLNDQQRYDWEALQIKQRMYTIKQKDISSLSQQEMDFLNKFDSYETGGPNARNRTIKTEGSMANPTILTDESQLPTIASSSQGTTGLLEKVDTPGRAKDMYRHVDYTTGKTEYYYVIKSKKRFQSAAEPSNLLTRYNEIAQTFQKDPRLSTPPSAPPPGGVAPRSTSAPKDPKIAKLVYSDDYEKLYEDERQRIALQALRMPDLVLATYDWETIDFVPNSAGRLILEADSTLTISYSEPESKLSGNVNPEIADLIYRVQNFSFAPVIQSLTPVRVGYTKYLKNFGFHRSGSTNLREYFPGYTQNGNPYYDIVIDFDDMAEVTGYTIYLVEEDGII